jgi:hypothetical protein
VRRQAVGIAWILRLVFVTGVFLLVLAPAAFAGTAGGGVNGAVYTTIDVALDGPGHCQNSAINCNIYSGKQFVWLNGGPTSNHLTPAGLYFFAVLNPGGQPNPNDPSTSTPNADNLSCPTVGCADPYTNRTFAIGTNGEISAYGGTHDKDLNGGNGILIRLCNGGGGCPPYIDTPNPGGEYDMAVCYLGPDSTHITYPVDTNKVCKHDNFKVRSEITPPRCTLTAIVPGPPKQIQVTVQDTGSGLASIVPTTVNATATVPAFTVGTTLAQLVTAVKIDQSKGASLSLTVTDVAGNVTTCDPVFGLSRTKAVRTGNLVRFAHVRQNASTATLQAGALAVQAIDLSVNGRVFHVGRLESGRTMKLDIASALRAGSSNVVVARVYGRRGARVTIVLSD